MEAPQAGNSKECPQCGAAFICSPHDCWCSRLPMVMPLNPEASCYCPECLQKAIAAVTQ